MKCRLLLLPMAMLLMLSLFAAPAFAQTTPQERSLDRAIRRYEEKLARDQAFQGEVTQALNAGKIAAFIDFYIEHHSLQKHHKKVPHHPKHNKPGSHHTGGQTPPPKTQPPIDCGPTGCGG